MTRRQTSDNALVDSLIKNSLRSVDATINYTARFAFRRNPMKTPRASIIESLEPRRLLAADMYTGPTTVQLWESSSTMEGNGPGDTHPSVFRFGSLDQPASVVVTTTNGGTAASDYFTPVSTTVHFDPGEFVKGFQIDTVGNTLPDVNKTIEVSLSSPTGATLGPITTASFFILDDDSGAALIDDSLFPHRGALLVNGTSGDDDIQILRLGNGKLEVLMNDVSQGVFNHPGRIIVYASYGDDNVTAQAGISQSCELHGGYGDDTITSAAGRDLLFGGDGRDVLHGRGNDDILVAETNASSSTFEMDPAASAKILSVWLGHSAAPARANAILKGKRGIGDYALTGDKLRDDSAADIIRNSNGRDLVYYSDSDSLKGSHLGDILVLI